MNFKFIYLLTAILLFQNCKIFCQTYTVSNDKQWVIWNSKGKHGQVFLANDFSNILNTNQAIQLEGVAFPEFNSNKENKLFRINSNGTYNLDKIAKGNSDIPNLIYGNSFNISVNSPPVFMYLANTYEEDDPPDRVKVKSISTGQSPNGLIPVSVQNPNFFAPFDFIDNTDITIVVNKQSINSRGNYRIKLVPSIIGSVQLEPSKFNNQTNMVCEGPSGMLLYGTSMFQFNANNELNFYSNGVGNYFFNFKLKILDTAIIGQGLTFQILNIDAPSPAPQPLSIIETFGNKVQGKYHDPNYIQLKCVWKKGKSKFGRYRVECFNSGSVTVDNVKFNFTMPQGTNMKTIKIDSYFIDNIKHICDAQFTTYSGNNVEMIFPGGVGIFNDSDHSDEAWVEFVVQFQDFVNIYEDNLDIYAATSTFIKNNPSSSASYPITPFIDNFKKCKQYTTGSGDSVSTYLRCKRKNKVCGINCIP